MSENSNIGSPSWTLRMFIKSRITGETNEEIDEKFKKKISTLSLEDIITENINKETKSVTCSVDIKIEGERYFNQRVLYKLSTTSEGKLYIQAGFK